MTAEFSIINTSVLTPPAAFKPRSDCETLVRTKIERGFHHELGIGPLEYAHSFENAIKSVVNCGRGPQGALPGLVEERIPFVRQLELLGVVLDPAIFYDVT